MRDGERVGVVIPAAGAGMRMGPAAPKQFLELEGKPIVAWTIAHFQLSPEVDSIVLAAAEAQIDLMKRIVSEYGYSKVCAVVAGGARRQDSVRNGLRALEERKPDLVLVHDAVRPFIDHTIILSVLGALSVADAAMVAIPVKETVKLAGPDGFVRSTPPREGLWIAQTPQASRYADLCRAFERAAADGVLATDEAGLLERIGKRVAIVPGSYDNIKITTPEDLELAMLIARRTHAHSMP
jgi:2-C-methyl-D-erythritol 4-phosphate cytidylyltransferase